MKPVVGHTYELEESEYRFGVGTILATVIQVNGPTDYAGELWWSVKAHTAYGTARRHGGWEYREFLEVRARNLRSARVAIVDVR